MRVRDVADVKILHQDRAQSIGFEQKDAVVITVFRRLGGNTRATSRANVAELLDRRDLTLPAGVPSKPPPRNIQATVVYDQARFVNTAVDNVRDAILIGGLFSILILLAFLRSWRATLISALAIPVTLAITFPVPALDRRDAQPDVARRPGRRHRPDHRRHGRGHREHRPAPARRAVTDGDAQRSTRPHRPTPVDAASGEITGPWSARR